jgi:hypothetical protein
MRVEKAWPKLFGVNPALSAELDAFTGAGQATSASLHTLRRGTTPGTGRQQTSAGLLLLPVRWRRNGSSPARTIAATLFPVR